MESLDGKLGRLVQEFNRGQLKEFRSRTRGGESVETLIFIAESVAKDEALRESGRTPIRRNNGGSSYAEPDRMSEADAVLFSALSEARPQAFKKNEEVRESGRLTQQEEQDFEFARLIGLSESDALKVAKSNAIRG